MTSRKLKRETDTQQTLRDDSAAEAVTHVGAEMSSADDDKWLTFPKAHGQPLLPVLPNDITLAQIVPRLGWRDFYTLSAVSPA